MKNFLNGLYILYIIVLILIATAFMTAAELEAPRLAPRGPSASAILMAMPQQVAGGALSAGTTCATANACVTISIDPRDSAVAVVLGGTFVATASFEATAGSLWSAISGPTWTQGAAASSATAAGAWVFDVAGKTGFRVRLSAYTSGTVNVDVAKGLVASSSILPVPQSLGTTSSPTFAALSLTTGGLITPQTMTSSRSITLMNASGAVNVGEVVSIILCGDLANSGTLYYSPVSGFPEGDFYAGGASYAIAGAGCAAEDNATEGTADEVLYLNNAVKIIGMSCKVTSSGSNGVTLTLRSATADLTPTVAMTIATGATTGTVNTITTTDIAQGATFGLKAVTTEDLSTQDVWCLAKAIIIP